MNLTEVTVSRIIPASPERVFDVWMDPKSPAGPWVGAERLIINPVVDGLFFFSVHHEGKVWPHYGRFIEIDRPNRAQYTWVSKSTKGEESLVSITFEPRGDETQMTLRHSGVPDDEMGRGHVEGWTWVLSQLAKKMAGPPRELSPKK